MNAKEKAAVDFERAVARARAGSAEAPVLDTRAAEREEAAREDALELAQLKAAEAGTVLSLRDEIKQWYLSTNNLELRARRIDACLRRRDAECTVTFCLDNPDVIGEAVWAFLAGLEFNAEAGQWLPTRTPARRVVTLRRVDRKDGGAFAPFHYKTKGVSADARERKAMSREWQLSGYAGLDPTCEWVEVVPDKATGIFTAPLLEARKILNGLRDTQIRTRRRSRGEADSHPIIAEGATSAYVPVVARKLEVAS